MNEPRSVEQSWADILGWLQRHTPPDHASLHGPASPDAIAEVEQAIGLPIPGDQKSWWKLSDGTVERGTAVGLIPVAWIPASTKYALQRYRMLLNFVPDEPELSRWLSAPAGTPCPAMWLPAWLPIAHNLGGDHLFLDLRPGDRSGCVSVHRKDEIETGEPVWPHVAAMLAEVAAALTDGTLIGDQRAVVVADRLSWLPV